MMPRVNRYSALQKVVPTQTNKRTPRERGTTPCSQMQEGEQCHISTSWSRSCQTDENGLLRCETLKRMYRHCPGRAPEIVQEERAEEGAEHQNGSPFGGGGAPSLFGRGPGDAFPSPSPFGTLDPFHIFQQFEQRMEALMGMGGLFRPPQLQQPPGWQLPPPPAHPPPHSPSQPPSQPPPRMRVHEA